MTPLLDQLRGIKLAKQALRDLEEIVLGQAIHAGATWQEIARIDRTLAIQTLKYQEPELSLIDCEHIVRTFMQEHNFTPRDEAVSGQ